MENMSVVLDEQTCGELLASDTVARVAFGSDDGPGVATVAYRLGSDRIAFCAEEDSELARCAPGHPVAVQVDLIDRVLHRGWTVTAVGQCRILETPADHPCRAWTGDRPTIALGVLTPTLSGRWVGTASRSM